MFGSHIQTWNVAVHGPCHQGPLRIFFFARPHGTVPLQYTPVCVNWNTAVFQCSVDRQSPQNFSRWSASNRFGFFRQQYELSQKVCRLIQYNTVAHSEFSPACSNLRYDGLWGDMVWRSVVRIFLATTWTCTKATVRSVLKYSLLNQVRND